MSKKKILFRADGNSKIGLGHLYRIFSLIEAIKLTYDYVLVTSELSTLKVIPNTYKVFTIPKEINILKEPEWLYTNFSSEEYILIADGYQFTSLYQKEIKKYNYSLMYIDDLTTEYMYADVVLNHSPRIKNSDYKSETYTKFALGTKYTLLRPTFLSIAKKNRKIKKIDSVFLCFGGADKYNFTKNFFELLIQIDYIKEIHIVIGGAYKHATKFKNKKSNMYKNLNEEELLKVMQKCNLAIVPTSTILLELCCVNTPIISGFLEENQKKAYNSFKKLKAIVGVGNFRNFEFTKKNLEETIATINIEKAIEIQSKLLNKNQNENFIKLISKL